MPDVCSPPSPPPFCLTNSPSQKDRDRTVYGLKEKGIGKIFIKLMKINKTSPDAFALINWKLPGMRSAATGDFAGRCYEVIRKRPMRTSPGSLTVAQVNDMLDRLSLSNKEEQQLPIMEEFYMNMCAEELMWMVRIILKRGFALCFFCFISVERGS